jgi:hypothetical protein
VELLNEILRFGAVSEGWARFEERAAPPITELPEWYAKRLQNARERAERAEVVPTIGEAKKMLYTALC